MDPNAHVQVFCKAIQANGEMSDVGIVNMFCFTLRDTISYWGKKIIRMHLVYRFEELKVAFYKFY